MHLIPLAADGRLDHPAALLLIVAAVCTLAAGIIGAIRGGDQ